MFLVLSTVQNNVSHSTALLIISLLVGALSAANAQDSEQQLKREWQQKDRDLKKQLYGVEKPWELLAPYGIDTHHRTPRSEPQNINDPKETEARIEAAKKRMDRMKYLQTGRSKSEIYTASQNKPEKQNVPAIINSTAETDSKLAKLANQRLKQLVESRDYKMASEQYAEMRRSGYSIDHGLHLRYARFLKSIGQESQSRMAAMAIMRNCSDEERRELIHEFYAAPTQEE